MIFFFSFSMRNEYDLIFSTAHFFLFVWLDGREEE